MLNRSRSLERSTARAPTRTLSGRRDLFPDDELLTQPYDRRRALLEQLDLPDPERITVVPSFPRATLSHLGLTPEDLLARSAAAGYEGLVAKRRASLYHPGQRSREWLKHPLIHTQEVIVCGWRLCEETGRPWSRR
jgi:bifunctional non-homologous end joining protein LigD